MKLIDLGVINYLGRQAKTSDQLPCCRRPIDCPDISFPTSQRLCDLLKMPLYLLWSQIEALKRIEELIRLTKLKGDIVPSRIMNEFAACLDHVFFDSALMPRVNIFWCKLGDIVHKGFAYTSPRSVCPTHRQVHCVDITSEPSKEPERSLLRRCYQNDPEAMLPEWLERVFGSLVHERCHARLLTSRDRSELLVRDFLELYGIAGHGSAFEGLFGHIAGTLQRAGVLRFDMELLLHRPVREDKSLQDKIFRLANQIEGSELGESEIIELLADGLPIPKERAACYRKAFHADYTTLEIVTLVYGAGAMNCKLAKDSSWATRSYTR